MLEKCTKENFEEKSVGKYILVIGAGKIGTDFIKEYGNRFDDRMFFFDNNYEKQRGGILVEEKQIEVFPIMSINDYDSDSSVIVIANRYYSELYKQMKEIGCIDRSIFVFPFIKSRKEQIEDQVKQCLSDYYYYNHFDLSKRNEFIDKEYEHYKNKGGMVLPYLPLYLTTRCTLNCDKCNNLMPYFKEKKSNCDISFEFFEKSLSRILNCVQELIFCELVGGEPFLYSDLEKILNFVGSQSKIRQIVIVTNGTVIPNENILRLLKKYNVLVRISDYGLFEKIAKLVAELEKYDINVRILQDMKWNDPGDISKRNRTLDERFFQYNKCIFSLRCKYLTGNKLFTCARIASLDMLGIYNGDDDILLIDDTLTEEKLMDFYLNENGSGCDYCDLCTIDSGEEIPAAIQRGDWQIKHSNYTIIRNDHLERLKKK